MKIRAVDTEAGRILPGLLAPPLACVTHAERVGEQIIRDILDPGPGLDWVSDQLETDDVVLAFQNAPFDMGVIVQAEHDLRGPAAGLDMMRRWFRALRKGRITDTKMRESLLLLRRGYLSFDPREGPRGGKPATSLGAIAARRLGLDISADKTDPDAPRLLYGTLLGIPVWMWPEKFRRYAMDDPAITLLCWEHQGAEAAEAGYLDAGLPWMVVDEARKVATDWALHLHSCWGMRTDPERVAEATRRIEAAGKAVEELLLATGLGYLKTERGETRIATRRALIQERVALAYAHRAIDPEALREWGEEIQARAELASGEDDDEAADLTPEQVAQLEVITRDPEAVSIEVLGGVDPTVLEEVPLPRLTWADEGKKAAVAAPPEAGMIVQWDHTGAIGWKWPEGYVEEEIAKTCAGQVVTKVSPGGGGIAYRDRRTGRIITPLTDPSKTFPTGQVSYARDTLEMSGDPVLILLAALGKVTKLRTTYVPILAHGTTHPINPRYWLPKESGRTSCSGPNVQNLPTFGGIRECFVARPGWALLAADIDQAECVAWAQWCLEEFGFSRMAEVLREGLDPHLNTAISLPQLAGMTYEEAKAKKDAGDPFVKLMRQYAKSPGVFGWMGGMGAPTMSLAARGYGVETTLAQAQEVISALNATYPEGRFAARWASEMCENDKRATFTQRGSGRQRGGCNYTALRNTVFQGGTADHANDVLFHEAEECYLGGDFDDEAWARVRGAILAGEEHELLSPLCGARPWAFEHDGFFLEVPYDTWGAERSTRAAERLEEVIRERGAFWFPDVPTRTSAALARSWIKNRAAGREIKQIRNAEGHLIPCDDPNLLPSPPAGE